LFVQRGASSIWLIAEDEADIRNLVAMMCQVWGHTALTFESGQKLWEWLDAIEAGKHEGALPEFALMDIRMPGKRGNEIALRMRSIPALKDIAIVMMTAFVMSEDEMEKMRQEYGIDYIINKPLPDFDRLHVVLHDIIEQKRKQQNP
jgi:CheY-like chemotaxis protein